MGKEYTAYKISCETWTKTVIQIATSSDDKVVGKSAAKTAKKYNKKSVEITNAIGDNTQGYKVSPQDMWFVPELGTFAKIIYYDSQKVLINYTMELTSFQ